VGAAYRASGMLSLRALGAVDHAGGARVLAVGQFEVGLVAVVQRGPNWWDLVVGGVVHTFEDAAGALAAQGLNALIAVGGPGAQQVVRAAGQDLGQILTHPGAFFGHLAAALGAGFGLFAGDLGGNLERGALQWLTGQGGLTLPAPDAAGLLTVALETTGVSYAAFTGDLAAAFTRHHRDGARLVAGLDTLYGYAPALHDLTRGPGGPAGQRAALAGHLISEVKTLDVQALVFAQLKAVLGPQLLLRVAPTLLGYLIPGADVAEAVGAVVRLVGVVTDQAAGLAALGTTVVTALHLIVAGKESDLKAAAEAIDRALQKAVPVVLALAASVVGVDLAHIGRAILDRLHAKEVVVTLRKGLAELAGVVAELLLKAVPAAVLARLEGHAAPTSSHKSPAPAHHGGATTPVTTTARDELHVVLREAVEAVNAYAGTRVDEATVRGVLSQVVEAHQGLPGLALEPLAEERRWAIRGRMEAAGAAPTTTHPHPHPHASGSGTRDAVTSTTGAGLAGQGDAPIVDTVGEAARRPGRGTTGTATGHEVTETDLTKAEVGTSSTPRTFVTHTVLSGGRAGTVVALPLTVLPGNTAGSRPRQDPPSWHDVLRFDRGVINRRPYVEGPTHWEQLHLLSERFHGPGESWNLVSGHKIDNAWMRAGPEADVRRALDTDAHLELFYRSSAEYFAPSEGDQDPHTLGRRVTIENFARYVRIEWGYAKQDENHNWVEDRTRQTHTYSKKMIMPLLVLPEGNEVLPIDIKTIGRDTLRAFGLDWPFAEAICRVRIDGLELPPGREDKDFRDRADFIACMTAFYARQGINFMTTTTLWPEIEALINNGDAVL